MEARVHESFESFWAQAGMLYEADPGRHSIPLTINAACTFYEAGAKPSLVTVHGIDGVCGAYLRTPPFPGHVSALPPQVAPTVAEALRDVGSDVDRVFGPEREARAFADAWCAESPRDWGVEARVRRYELGTLERPHDVSGQRRPCDDADVSWLAQWHSAYARDVDGNASSPDPSEAAMRSFIAGGREPVLWALDGDPRAMAFVSRPLHGMSRIGHVYTPLEYRGRGYGSAVTAAAAAAAREMGAGLVMLYADLANPVSNSIYRRLGFRPVEDVVDLNLGSR